MKLSDHRTDGKRSLDMRIFNPIENPEQSLSEFNRLALDADPETLALLESARVLLVEFLQDQASSVEFVILDCESTELIQSGTAISEMEISVTTVLFQEASGYSFDVTFWRENVPRGAPLSLLPVVLEAAQRIVAYNGQKVFSLVLNKIEPKRKNSKLH